VNRRTLRISRKIKEEHREKRGLRNEDEKSRKEVKVVDKGIQRRRKRKDLRN
jgi:hypothetical protein